MGVTASAARAVAALALIGCIPDGWSYPTPRDASAGDASLDATALDAPTADHGTDDAPCATGRWSCGGVCVPVPVSLYRGDGDARDSFGAQHAALSGVSFVEGRFGQAFFINGAGQYVTIPPGVGDFAEDDFTIALWFKTSTQGVMLARRAACWGVEGFSGLDLGVSVDGRVAVEVFSYPSNYYILRSEGGFNDDQWHHAALLRRGATLALGVDGNVVDTHTVMGDFDDRTHSPSYLGVSRCVAGSPGNNGNVDPRAWYVGALDELAFHRRALSTAELLAAAEGRCAP